MTPIRPPFDEDYISRPGYPLQPDGSSDYGIQANFVSTFFDTSGTPAFENLPLSVSFWLKLNTGGITQELMCKWWPDSGAGGLNAQGWEVWVNSSNQLNLAYGQAVSPSSVTSSALTVGKWYYCTCGYNGTNAGQPAASDPNIGMNIFINGKYDVSSSFNGWNGAALTPQVNGMEFMLWARPTNNKQTTFNRFSDANLLEIQIIYEQFITQHAAARLWNNGQPLDPRVHFNNRKCVYIPGYRADMFGAGIIFLTKKNADWKQKFPLIALAGFSASDFSPAAGRPRLAKSS